jgi:glucokinase
LNLFLYFYHLKSSIVNRQSINHQTDNTKHKTHNPQHKTSMSHVIALDLGGTKLSTALFDEAAHCSHRKSFLLSGMTGHAVGELILEAIHILIKEAANDHIKVSSISICVPGISYPKTGHVWAPNIPGWEDYPLRDEMERSVKDIKVVVDNDRACSVLGERWKGAAQECENAVFLAIGTGIGAGIVTDGKVLRGAHDIAGAIGWMALQKPYHKKYDACGCFEYYASGEGLVRAAKEFMNQDKSYKGNLSKILLDTRAIFNAYEENDVIAQKTIKQAIEYW